MPSNLAEDDPVEYKDTLWPSSEHLRASAEKGS